MMVPVEFHLDNLKISSQLEEKIRSHFAKWTKGHHDISNFYLSVKQLSGGKSVNQYEAKVIIYHRPDHIIVTHKSAGIPEAVSAAVRSAERHLRETRKLFKDKRRRASSNNNIEANTNSIEAETDNISDL